MANTVNVTKANTFEQWRVKTNELGTAIGDLDTLTSGDSGGTTIIAALNLRDNEVEANTAIIGTAALWDTTNYGTLRKAANKNHADIETIAATLGISGAFSLSGYTGSETTLVAILNAQRAVDTTQTTNIATGVTNTAAVNTKLGTITAAAMGTTASTVGPAILELHAELTTATANISGVAAANVAVAGDTMTGKLITASSGLGGSNAGVSAATLLTLGTGSSTALQINSSQRIGIGKAAHGTHKVDVSGNLNATTLSYAGTDLATKFVPAGELFEDAVGAMFDGTETGGISATYNDSTGNIDLAIADDGHNHVVSQIDGFTENVQDIVGAMVTSNTESGIGVTYQDGDGTLDFNVNDPTITLTGDVTGAGTMTNLGSFSIATTSVSPTIANSSITTLKLADNAVTNAKMADNAINTAELANNAVTQAKMADDSVGSAEMKTLSTLLIINSAGTTVKTLHGAGA